ncbi:MAG: hypothetical protein P9L92_05245 [Candidatus Electryonea clarkiae]|nr:hypothetical protein [Candidatus Electryonea clarkiae]MDP8286904.1 hypothetical protein [Candidatus Electryonea clarkiae]
MKIRYSVPIVIICSFISILFHNFNASAFVPPNAKGIALGGEVGVTVRGAEAVGWNPAFLGFEDNPRMVITSPLLSTGLHFYNNSFSVSTINTYFQQDKFLDESDKKEILDLVDEDGLLIHNDVFVPAIGFSFPTAFLNMSLNFNTMSITDARLDKDFIRVALKGYGYEHLGEVASFDDMEMTSANFGRISLTGAKRFEEMGFVDETGFINEFTAGFTFSYFMGFAYVDLIEANASLYADYGEFDGNGLAEIVSSFGGNGVGLDLGMGFKFANRRGIYGVSIINAINKIHWTDCDRRLYSFDTDFVTYLGDPVPGPSLQGMEDVDAWIEKNFNTVDSLSEGEEVTVSLPSSLLMSMGWWLREDLLASGAVRQGLNEAAGNTSVPGLSAGIEYLIHPKFPLRAGMGFDHRGGTSFGFGSGMRIGTWRTDVGFSYRNGLFNYSNGFTFGISTSFVMGQPETDPFKTKRYWENKAESLREAILGGNPDKEYPDDLPPRMQDLLKGSAKSTEEEQVEEVEEEEEPNEEKPKKKTTKKKRKKKAPTKKKP